jgi:N-acetylglucosaminyldiphosphoundecaprenol N-acetyl-beta-D-mannosaminyltransferase
VANQDGVGLTELEREDQPTIGSSSLEKEFLGDTVNVWGLPLIRWTQTQTADAVSRMIDARQPSYFITANLHYALLTSEMPELQAINEGAAFIVADGAPLVWASRWQKKPLPERVAGSDLIYDLCERAAPRGDRIFLLGAGPGVADAAARRLEERYPGLKIVGTASPSPEDLAGENLPKVLDAIRETKPDLLIGAFSQPKGDMFMSAHCKSLNVPVCVQLGATFDFVAGRVRRAPLWIQKIGMEWAYRAWLEPRRLASRYTSDAWFLVRQVIGLGTKAKPGKTG